MTGLHLTLGLFLLVLLGIGAYFYRTTDARRLADYMLAGRDVGTWPIAISELASVASGWTFFAWVGVGFTTGLHGLGFSLAMLLVILFMYRYVGPPFRRASQALNSQTVVDHLALTFQRTATGAAIRWVGTVAVVVFMISYVGAQLIAVGEALGTALDLPYVAAVLTGGMAVAVYTTLGGFSASVWTDVVQGVLVLIAALLLPIAALVSVGGWGVFLDEAAAIDPTLLSSTGGMGGGALVVALLAWLTFAMGTIFEITEFAFVGLGVTVGLPLAARMCWRRTTRTAVLATVGVGLVGTMANLYLLPELFPILVWPVAFAVLIGTSLMTCEPTGRSA